MHSRYVLVSHDDSEALLRSCVSISRTAFHGQATKVPPSCHYQHVVVIVHHQPGLNLRKYGLHDLDLVQRLSYMNGARTD